MGFNTDVKTCHRLTFRCWPIGFSHTAANASSNDNASDACLNTIWHSLACLCCCLRCCCCSCSEASSPAPAVLEGRSFLLQQRA